MRNREKEENGREKREEEDRRLGSGWKSERGGKRRSNEGLN